MLSKMTSLPWPVLSALVVAAIVVLVCFRALFSAIGPSSGAAGEDPRTELKRFAIALIVVLVTALAWKLYE